MKTKKQRINIHNKTNKFYSHKFGGHKFGRGFKGVVTDVCNHKKYDMNNLCRQMQKNSKDIVKITLYILNENQPTGAASLVQPVELTTPEQIADFIEYISSKQSNQYIAKEFYQYRIRESDFHNELNSYEPIYKSLNEMGANLVGMPYASDLLIGIEIEYKQSAPELLQNDIYMALTNIPFIRDMHEPSNKRYFVFNRKCQQTLTLKNTRHFSPSQFDKLVVQILEILVHLENSNIAHGDIKLDNIMICDDNYRLIDWEQGRVLDYIKIKTSISLGACPAYYILKFGNQWKAVFSLAIPFIIKVTGCNDLGHKNKCQYIYDAIDYYQEQFNSDSDEKTTFNRVRYTFDLFTFGLILYGILQHNPFIKKSKQFDKYRLFVNNIYKHNNAKEALLEFESLSN